MNERIFSQMNSCILMYDITNKNSFEECRNFNEKIKSMCKKDVKLLLLGNKSDRENDRQVNKQEGLKFAKLNGYIFYEISCKENINVLPAFNKIIEITEKDLEIYDKKIVLNKMKIKKKKKNCC